MITWHNAIVFISHSVTFRVWTNNSVNIVDSLWLVLVFNAFWELFKLHISIATQISSMILLPWRQTWFCFEIITHPVIYILIVTHQCAFIIPSRIFKGQIHNLDSEERKSSKRDILLPGNPPPDMMRFWRKLYEGNIIVRYKVSGGHIHKDATDTPASPSGLDAPLVDCGELWWKARGNAIVSTTCCMVC